jgi:hypothetical protein
MEKQFIEKIIGDAKERGYDVAIRDVSYAVLKTVLENELMAYTVVFGTPKDDKTIPLYEGLDHVKYLIRYVKKHLAPKEVEKSSDAQILKALRSKQKETAGAGTELSDITAEENKDAIIKRLGELKEMYDAKEISAKDYVKLDLEARVKLADKFDVTEEAKQQVYFLPPQYDLICPHTHRECYQINKEYAMKKFNLKETD